MCLHPRGLTEVPADTAALGRQILPASNGYRVIGDQLGELLDDLRFAALYEPTGRAALSPALLALVTVFQFVEDLPDRAAVAQVVVRVDWKYALHLPLADPGFDPSCLCYFRRRLLAHQAERLVFDQLLGRIQALGFCQKRGRQRTDSLAVLGAVAELSELELVSETLRLAVRALAAADAAWSAGALPASFREEHAQRREDYQLSGAARAARLQAVGADGAWLLDLLEQPAAPAALRALAPLQLLATVWAQHFVRGAGGPVQVRARGDKVPCTELIVTPHDAGVRAGQKRGKHWRGEKVHITETAEPGAPAFITDVTTSSASSGDNEALPQIRAQLAARDLLPAEQYVDSGYVSGTQLAQSEAVGIELVGPPRQDTSPNAFKIEDFQIDYQARQATCPAGQRSVKWCQQRAPDGSVAYRIHFAATTCAACPLRAQCTGSTSGRGLCVSEHHARLVARRIEAQTVAFKARMKARPAIESTLSELMRAHGLRRHRYRGDAQRHLENLLKAAACNLKRLTRALVARQTKALAAPAAGCR
jgi:transposase